MTDSTCDEVQVVQLASLVSVEPGHTQQVVEEAGDVTFLLAVAGRLAGELLKPEILLQKRKKEDGEDSGLELKLLIPLLLVSHEVEQSSVLSLLLVERYIQAFLSLVELLHYCAWSRAS